MKKRNSWIELRFANPILRRKDRFDIFDFDFDSLTLFNIYLLRFALSLYWTKWSGWSFYLILGILGVQLNISL